jgi:hypothetical protein
VEVKSRVRNGVQVPYVALDMTNGGKNSPIKQIVLGPKNPDEEAKIAMFMTSMGWNNVKIRRSDAPYK